MISEAERYVIECPGCGQEFETDIWTLVDRAEKPDLWALCLEGQLNVVSCPNGHRIHVRVVYMVYDASSKQMIFSVERPNQPGNLRKMMPLMQRLAAAGIIDLLGDNSVTYQELAEEDVPAALRRVARDYPVPRLPS